MKRTTLIFFAVRVSLALAAVAIVGVCGLGQEPAIAFGGLFEMTMVTTQTDAVTLDTIKLNTSLTLDVYTATLDATLTDTEFDTLRASVSGPLGPLALNSAVSFNPSTLSFISWQTGTTFTLFDVAFSDVFFVTTPQSSSYNQLTVSWAVGDLSFQASTKIGLCPLAYWESSVCVDWPWDDCDTNLSACVQINDTAGFQSLDMTMSDYTLFGDLLGVRWGLDVVLTYTPEEKTLTPTLKFQPDWFYCADIEVLGEITAGPTIASVEGISIYGIRGECAFTECLSFRFGESLAAAKNGSVTGKADYFEVLGISGCFPSCCGSDGSFDVAAYFGSNSTALFDLGLITGSVSFQLSPSFSFSLEAEFPAVGSGWRFATTWSVIW